MTKPTPEQLPFNMELTGEFRVPVGDELHFSGPTTTISPIDGKTYTYNVVRSIPDWRQERPTEPKWIVRKNKPDRP